MTEEVIEAATLAAALAVIVAARPDGERLRAVLSRSSFLVNGAAVSRAMLEEQVLADGAEVEVLPAFAGGLSGFTAVCAIRCGCGTLETLYPSVSEHVRSEVSDHDQ